MQGSRFSDLGQVVLDEAFADVDLALRRGRHIDREDEAWYAFLSDAGEQLEVFYARFGCELVHRADGYFYLLPTGDKLGRRHLSVPEMLVGQTLALLYLDPATVQSGGLVTRDEVLGRLAAVMGTDALMQALNQKKKRVDERVAQEAVRGKVAEALRKLSALGFITPLDGERLQLRSALLRFAEPVRGEQSPAQALEQLVARGEVMLGEAESFSGAELAAEMEQQLAELGEGEHVSDTHDTERVDSASLGNARGPAVAGDDAARERTSDAAAEPPR